MRALKQLSIKTLSIFITLIGFIVINIDVIAQEGTKQLMPNSNDRLWLEFKVFTGNNFGLYGCTEKERINIRLKAGEKMFFGMKMNTIAYSTDVLTNTARVRFRVKSPSGAIVYTETTISTLTTAAGLIDTYTKAVTGPNGAILNGTTISGGYNPLNFTAAETGDYYIEFTENSTNFDRFALEYFDVTVTNSSNNVVSNAGNPNNSAGRLWSRGWTFTNTAFDAYPVNAHFYVFTSDEFINKVNFKMYPYSFTFVVNSYGVTTYTEQNYIKRTQSLNGDQTTGVDISEYRVFFNDPDRLVWPNTKLSPPKVQVWTEDTLFMDYNYNRNPLYLPLDISQVVMEKNMASCVFEDVTIFKIEASIDGFTAILIDIDKDGEYSTGGSDRVIYRNMKKGLNYVIWNFKNDAGAEVAVGNYNASATFLGRGPAHFPLYDVEQMDGITTSSIRPFNKLKTTIYWDDSQITTWGDPTGLMDETQRKQLVVEKDVPRIWSWRNLQTTPHNGNLNTLNTWFNALDLGYSSIGLKVEESATKCVDGLAPWVGDIYKEGPKNTNLIFTAADFTYKFFDPRDYALSSIQVRTRPTNGTLKLSGVNVTVNQIITAANLPNLTYTPASSTWYGKENFEWKANNGTSWSNNQEKVYLIINTPPVISDIPDQTLCTNVPTGNIPFTIGDDEDINTVILTGFSADPTFVPNSGITIGGTGINRTVKITPVANKSGMAIIYVMADDGLSQSIEEFTVYVGPDLQFSGDTTVCTSAQLYLIAQETGATSYSWKYNGVVKSTAQSVQQAAGSVNVGPWSLTVVKAGCTSTRNFTVSVSPLTTYSGDVNVCVGENLSISATEVNASYSWKKGASEVSTSKIFSIPSAALTDAANNYTLYVSKDGCTNTSPQFTITVINSPNSGLAVSGSTVDPGKNGTITISNAQSGIIYNVYQGTNLVATATGANANLPITVLSTYLSIGDNTFTIKADNGNCEIALTNPGIIHVNTPGITVSAISGNTTEAGGTATFTINLNTQPTGNVSIALNSSDLTEGIISTANITFTSVNYSTPQTITVTGVNDNIIDGNISYTINTAAASSADANYNGMNATDVTVINTDNDVASVTVTPTSGLTTTEIGGTATFTVVLACQPSANVTIGISSNDLTEGTVSPSSITFTSANWSTAQTITITGVNDNIDDDNQNYSIITSATNSTDDSNFNNLVVSDVSVTNTDDDVAGITVNPTSGLTTTEAGGTATFTIVLTSQPTANVTIGLNSNNTAEGTVSPASLVFTTANWNTAQTVTITGVNDNIDDDNIVYSIITAQATSTDSKYNVINPSDVSVTNIDNDVAGITVTPTSGLTTTEAGGTATFTIVLSTQPTANVTIGLSSSNTAEGTVSPASLTFTASNWNTAQTVTITGVNDNIDDDNITYSIITAQATSADSKYNVINPFDVSVTNTDDDTAGLTVSKASVTTSESGGSETFTVRLNTQPASAITIGISSNNINEGTVSPNTLTFTAGNWNITQTVTVTGVDDYVVDGNISYNVTVSVNSGDLKYSALSSTVVSATNTDNDAAGVTITPTSVGTTEAGGTGSFSLVLTSQPLANVTISFTGVDATEGSIDKTSVIFTSANWNVSQLVTVTGIDDAIADGNITYTIITTATSTYPLYNGLSVSDVSVTNADNDVAGITVSPTSLTTNEGGSNTFTIALNTQPTADVTISITSLDLTEGTVNPSSVTFTNANWAAKTITITGVNDDVDDGDITYTIQTSSSTSTDVNYNGINPSDVTVTNIDDDVAGITVTPTSGLTTTEVGGTATFTVVLTSQPTANVTIGLTSSNTLEGTVSPASITFTSANWNTAQTVTITGVNDNIDDDNIAYSIITALATSTDGKYNVINPSDVSVTNIDNDVAGITVSPTSGLTTTEAGGTATFTVVLTSQPTANVTIGLTSSNTLEGTVSPASLIFTAANWNTAQTVTITGVNDNIDDDNIAYSIITALATSTDNKYNVINPSDVSVTNTDDDVAGITVTPTSGLTTTEAGGTATFTVRLNTQPTANVTIGLTSSNTTEGTVSPASLIFTTANWNTAQTVTITGVNDNIDDDNITYSIITAQATSTDSKYNIINPSDVSVTNTDDDIAGITVTPTSGLTTTEIGGTSTFTVRLNTQPTASVSIAISSNDATEGSVSPASVTFSTVNWSTPQTITITGLNDNIDDGNIAYTITTNAATSTDTKYNGINPLDVSVINTDDDVAGITVTPTSGLTTTEAGGIATFTVILTSQPTANVTIGLSSSNTAEGTVSPATLTFTAANWNSAQSVTVTGVNDFIDDGNIAYTIVTAAASSTDGIYNNMNASDVSVTNTDDDVTGITVTPTAGLYTKESGTTVTFTVRLNSQPTANVSIGLNSSNTNEGTVSPASLTFTASNWNTTQTVTVTGVNDFVDDGDIAYNIFTNPATSADLLYNNLDAQNVSITNQDDDVAEITISPLNLTINEEGSAKTFTVVLNSEPTQNVTIGISSNNTLKGTVLPTSITFTSLNWNTAQAVSVTPVDNFIDDGDIAFSIVTDPATSLDDNYKNKNASDVTVTSIDNDVAGIIVSAVSGSTSEDGTTATFTVKLKSQPVANVSIDISSSDITEGTIIPVNLTFTSANWNTPQTVTITGIDDAVADGNQTYYILLAASVSTDDNYNGIDPDDITVVNSDNDSPGVTVFSFEGLTTTEAGGTATFTVVLNSQPTANVTIGITSSDLTEGTVSPANLTFTSADWSTPKIITVTGVDDLANDGDVAYTINLANTVSTDVLYNGLTVQDASVTNFDDATPRATDDIATTNEDTDVNIDVLANDKGLDKGGLSISISQQPSYGSLIINANNTITYHPNGLFNGDDTFIYKVCNGAPACDEATVTITVTGVNDLPIAVADARGTSKNTPVTVDVLFNDYGMEDGGIVVSIDEAPDALKGTAVRNPDNTITFTPALNFIGIATFKYKLTDLNGDNSIAIVTINVREINTVPKANNDNAETIINTPIDISVLANDIGLDDGFGKLSIYVNASHGTLIVNPDRTIKYTPATGYIGNDSFQYLIEDVDGDYDIATVSITITAKPNYLPVANADRCATNYNTPVIINVLINDTGLEDGVKSVIISSDPVNGNVVVNGDFTVTYTPNSGFSGIETFGYQVSDNDNDRATATATVTVLPNGVINHTPVAMDDAVTTIMNTAVVINVLANDTGLEDGFGGLLIHATPLHGTAVVNANRTITYTPSNLFEGNDSFQYWVEDIHGDFDIATVTITVTDKPNYIPIANNDRRGTEYQTAVIVDVLVNDTGLEDGGIVVNLSTPPIIGEGSAVVNGNNTITFTPAAGFSGIAVFGYTVKDKDSDSGSATVTITVLPNGITNHIPVAVDDAATTIVNKAVDINVLANDSGLEDGFGDLLIHKSPLHGTVIVNANRTITYTPSNLFIGGDSFQYWVEDVHGDYDIATVTITVTDKPNYIPVANNDSRGTEYQTAVMVDVLVNDTGLEDGGIVVSLSTPPVIGEGSALVNGDNTITFTPAAGFSGTAIFGYTVKDKDGDSGSATVTITVLPDGVTNHIPVAVNDNATTLINTPVDINVLANDSGLDDGFGALLVFTNPTHGTALVNANRTITYTPSNMFIGSDNFQYWVEDVHGDKAIATVNLTVTDKPNYIPVANDDRRGTNYETPVIVDVLVNDTGLEDGGIVVTLTTTPAVGEGTAIVNGNNTITFTPVTGFSGVSIFGYTVTDKDGDSDNANVTITVLPDGVTNHVPVAVDDNATTTEGKAVTINILANDSNLDDGIDEVTIYNSPKFGAVVVNSNFTVTYTPSANFVGSDSFDYMVIDAQGDYGIARVYITVNPKANSVPVANDDSRGTKVNTDVIVDVLANDTGLDDGGLVLSVSSNPSHGTVVVNTDKTVSYSPSTDYIGTDSFIYQICDIDNECSTATVTINVKVNNSVPNVIDDKLFTKVNTAGTFDILSNDLGLEDGGIKVELLNQIIAGTVVVNSDNTITYTPLTGFEGTDVFDYKVTDVDGDYDIATVTMVVTSSPIPGFNFTPLTTTTDESGTTASISVTLTRAPSSNVVINFTSGDLTEGTISPASITFTSSNWNTAQNVTVTGINDFIIDGSVAYDVTAHVDDALSDDDFDWVADQKVAITNTDNDVAGFTLSKTTAATSEALTSDNFTAVLNAQPNTDVVISVTSEDITEGTVSPANLTFTVANWNIPQQVTVTGVNDLEDDGIQTYNVTLSIVDGSSDDNFDLLTDQFVEVTNINNNSPVAVNDVNSINEGEIDVTGNILDNDTDLDNDVLTVSEINGSSSIALIAGSFGTLACDAQGNYTYTLDVNNEDVKSLNNGESLTDTLTYIVTDGKGGNSSAKLVITINGYTNLDDVIVPKGFSPDGDGISDTFTINGIENYPDNELFVYNRWGSRVYSKKHYNNEWDGRSDSSNGKLPVGTYFYILNVKGKTLKGYVYIKY